jgi:hypothetical protein
VSVGSKTFFITAAHVLDLLVSPILNTSVVSVGPDETDATTLGPGGAHRTNETTMADVDVAIFLLSDEVVAKLEWELRNRKKPRSPLPMSEMNEFVIFGYPNSLIFPGVTISYKPIPLFCVPINTLVRRLRTQGGMTT